MKPLVGLDALSSAGIESSSVTIGTFDGVHIGHRTLIAQTIEDAARRESESVALTWDRHPNETLRPERTPPLLTTPERKIELLAETGLDRILVLPFDRDFSQWAPERFVKEVLVAGLAAEAVFVGSGWRFGHRAMGTTDLLVEMGADLGFETLPTALEEVGGEPVSSSRVRRAVAAGDVTEARVLLGRPFDIDGPVVKGDARGEGLGFPTANIELDPRLAHPPRGVYACRARVEDIWYAAATNLGVNPTFGGDPEKIPPRVEAYLLDFHGDLYGKTLRVEFHVRLRDELKFDSAEALVSQIGQDVDAVRRVLDVGLR